MDPDKVTQEEAVKLQGQMKELEASFYRFINGTPEGALNNLKRLVSKAGRLEETMDGMLEGDED